MMGALVASEDVTELQLRSLHIGMTELKGQMEKLTDAVSKLAVIEERQANVASALERAFTAIAKQGERIDGTSKTFAELVMKQDERIHTLEKAFAAASEQHSGVAKWVDRALVGLGGFGAAVAAKSAGVLN